jgi:hypothetical protein
MLNSMFNSRMKSFRLTAVVRAVGFGFAIGVASVSMVAQEPADDPGWQQRCSTLDASMMAIDKGSAPAELLAMTTGVAGEKFAAVARERSAAGQHYVACTLFFTAAMAERQGNNGKVSTARAHSDVVLGFAEMKLGQGKSLGFAEKMMRTEEKVMALADPAITPADLMAVLAPFGGAPPVGMPGPVGAPMPPGGPMPVGGAPVGVDPAMAATAPPPGDPGAPVGAALVAPAPVGAPPAVGPGPVAAAAPAAVHARTAGTPHAATQTAAVHKPYVPGEHPGQGVAHTAATRHTTAATATPVAATVATK